MGAAVVRLGAHVDECAPRAALREAEERLGARAKEEAAAAAEAYSAARQKLGLAEAEGARLGRRLAELEALSARLQPREGAEREAAALREAVRGQARYISTT